jgi:hypothetical protein
VVHLEIVLILMQDRCTVCAKHTIGSEIIWTHLMVLLGDEAQVEARFGTIGSKIILDAPDGTPRRCGSCGILFRSVGKWC